jgi:hypothetical protein
MKIQKRFQTEAEIIDAIDDCHMRSKAFMAQAQKKEDEIKSDIRRIAEIRATVKWPYLNSKKDAQSELLGLEAFLPGKRLKQKKLERSASNLIEKKAKRLGAALSAFRTQPMESVLRGDHSVVLV